MPGGAVDATVELRVHGVSGTPAEQMLDCPTEFLDQVAGDKAAGFYRCRCECDDDDVNRGATETPVKEAYSWGGLTSGPATRALWLLFLPFLLINLAHWMLPPSATGRGAAGVAVRFLRLLGLSLTLTLMLAAVEVAVDIVGWQCAAVARCGNKLGPVSGLIYAPVGVRLTVTALPVALMLVGLLFLGRANPASGATGLQESRAPVDVDSSRQSTPPDSAVTTADVPLADRHFWAPDDSVKRLRACHVMAWASGLAAVVLFASTRYTEVGSISRWVCWALLMVNVVVLAASIAITSFTRITGRGGPRMDGWTPVVATLQWVSVGLLAGSLALVAFTTGTFPPGLAPNDMAVPTHLPGLRNTIYALLLVQVVMLVVLFAATAGCMKGWRGAVTATVRELLWPVPQLIRRRTVPDGPGDGWAPTLRGFTAAFVATIAVLAGGGFSTGVGLWTAQYFGNPVPSTQAAQCLAAFRAKVLGSTAPNVDGLLNKQCGPEKIAQLPPLPASAEVQLYHYNSDTPLIVPPAYFVAALVFFCLVVTLLVAAFLVWRLVIPRWVDQAAVRADYRDYTPADDPRVLAVAKSRALASLADYAPAILARVTGLAVIALAAVGFPCIWIYESQGFSHVPITVPVLSNISVAAISATAAGLVAIAIAAFRNRKQRRVVGILWDVITFWPRANHPLTPPCYAERTVPDLKGQLGCLTEVSPVVLSAHSQGTIIAAATLLQTNDDIARGVALLTFGCPLRRLYGRNFPAYFGRNTMSLLSARQPQRWLNLWARTDPIGGWIFEEGAPVLPRSPGPPPLFAFDLQVVDHRLLDVSELAAGERGVYPPICGHSGFWTRAEYRSAVEALRRELPGG